MNENAHVLRVAADLAAQGRAFVLATVVSAKGSTPRNPGAKMLWLPGTPGCTRGGAHDDASSGVGGSGVGESGDAWVGTVGGGQFERLVFGDAEKALRRGTCAIEKYVLGSDADQCCGGVMEVFFEPYAPHQRVVIFGAGHVAFEIARLLLPASVQVVIVDDRPEWNSEARFPGARRVMTYGEGIEACREKPDATLACVMTCSHDVDLDILNQLLSNPPAFLGLIGSRSKRACLFGRLVAAGQAEEAVQKVRCPIGVGDTGKEPPLVAVSIVAELLLEAKKLARL